MNYALSFNIYSWYLLLVAIRVGPIIKGGYIRLLQDI